MAEQTTHVTNGLDMETLHATIAAIKGNPSLAKCRFRARNTWESGGHNRSDVSGFYGAGEEKTHKKAYSVHSDEPNVLGGTDLAPNPVEHLLNALVGCLTTGIVAHAAVRGIPIDAVKSEIEGDLDLQGFLGLADVPKGFTNIRVKIKVKSDVDDLDKLRELTKFSPVLENLTQGTKIDVNIERA